MGGISHYERRVGIECHYYFARARRNPHVLHSCIYGSKGDRIERFTPINKESMKKGVLPLKWRLIM